MAMEDGDAAADEVEVRLNNLEILNMLKGDPEGYSTVLGSPEMYTSRRGDKKKYLAFHKVHLSHPVSLVYNPDENGAGHKAHTLAVPASLLSWVLDTLVDKTPLFEPKVILYYSEKGADSAESDAGERSATEPGMHLCMFALEESTSAHELFGEFGKLLMARENRYAPLSPDELHTLKDRLRGKSTVQASAGTHIVCRRPLLAKGLKKEDERVIRQYEKLERPLPLVGQGIDPNKLQRELDEEFPWFAPVTATIAANIRLRQMGGMDKAQLSFAPLLVVGPAGIGKTRYGRRLAEITGVAMRFVSAAGSSDNRMFQGTARGWGSMQPAYPLVVINETGIANPIIQVDEVDKIGGGNRNGNLADTLLQFTERESSQRWNDECLLTECDLSMVNWIFTANTLESIPYTLRTRLQVVRVSGPETQHFSVLLRGILEDMARELEVNAGMLPELDSEQKAVLYEFFENTRSVRLLARGVRIALDEQEQRLRMGQGVH